MLATLLCKHHYVIDTPNGPTCNSRCKRCGATKMFNTTIPEELELGYNQRPPVYQSKESWVEDQERLHMAEALVAGEVYHPMKNVMMGEAIERDDDIE